MVISLRVRMQVLTNPVLPFPELCVSHACVYFGVGTVCSRCVLTNPLSMPCTQSTLRWFLENQFTGSVEALGKLTKLTNMYVC